MSSAPKAEAGEATRRSQRAKKPSADVRAAARLKAERVASRSRRVGRLKAGYLQGLLAPPDAAAERDDFYKDLQSFYRRRWQVNLRAPRIAGVSLDLFELYSVVSKQGGWVKVTERDAWWDVAAQIGVPDSVAGADHALKLTYMRYLNRYEKYRLFGDSGDGEEEGDNSSSSRRSQRGSFLANLATADCPFYRSRADLPESVRSTIGLPDLTPSPSLQYRRLIRSLQSGLPNELDFAVNVLTLLSHPGPKLIRLESAPQIVPLLLAHLGVFADGPESMRPLYEGWRTEDRLPFLRFWAAALKDDEEAKLLGPVPGLEKIRAAARTSELFAGGLAPSFDQTKPLPHRVHQIASILRNLSFEAPNRKPMAASPVLLKFLHLCIRSRFAPLQTAAFDILSNVAPELVLSSSALVLGSVAEGLASEDKLAIVRSLETLASLCGKEENEDGLIDFLTPERLRKVISYLTVKDIMLAVYVLEALYQVSELGATTADRIAAEPHAMAVLVDLATVEAVSFGPAGLAGMKVVEYGVPQASALPPGTRIVAQPVGGSRAMAPPQGPPTIIRPAQPRPVHIISSALASHAAGAVPSPPPHSRAPMASSPAASPAPSAAVPPIAIQSTLLAAALPGEGDEVDAERAAEIQNERAEELTITWLKTNLVVDPSATTSRGELYAAYVGEMHKVYMSLAVSASTLASLLKKHFPMTSSRRVEGGSRPNAWAIDGVRYVPARIPVAAVAPAPLAKALTAAPSTSAGPSTLVQQYPIVNSILSTPSGGTPKRTLPATVSATRGPVRILVVRKPNAEAAKAPALAAATSGPLPVAMEENSRDSARTGSPESLVSAPTTEEANSLSPATTSDNPQRNGAALALPPNCHLEVCAEPKEAKDLIDQGREHEARIVRIENTTGAGASGDQAAKGQVAGDKEEKKEEAMDTSAPLPTLNGAHSPPPLPTPPPAPTSNGSSLSNGKGPNGVKPSALAVVAVSGEAKGQQPTPPAPGAPPQRTPSPGEMNRNILNSQAGIAELLKTEEKAPTLSVAAVNGSVREEGSEASNDAAPNLATPPTTPVKTPAKGSASERAVRR